MRKGILLGIVFLLFISLASATNVCTTEVYPSTDCLILSPAGMTCSTYSVYNPTGTKIVNNAAMTELASTSGVYYATFNYAPLGDYTLVLCDNTTSHLNVINTTSSDPLFSPTVEILNQVYALNSTIININATVENINGTLLENINNTLNAELSELSLDSNNSNQIYLFLFIFGLVFMVIGYVVDDNYLKAISGMIFTAVGIYIIRYGFYNLNNEFIQYAVSIICLGLGFYLMIRHVLIIVEESMK